MSIGQILIGKDVAYGLLKSGATIASYNDIINLAHGAVAIFNGENNHFVDAAADLLDAKEFFIAVGGSTTKEMRFSKKISRRANITGRPYQAAVNETMFLGDNDTDTYDMQVPATLVVGSEAIVVVESRTEYNLASRYRKTYSHVVKSSDTEATILASIAAKIAADATARVTCTVIGSGTANTGLKFVLTNNEELVIYGQGIFIDAPVVKAPATNCVARVIGCGSAAQILEIEKEYMLNEGDGNTIAWKDELFSYANQTDSTKTYEQIIFSWTPEVTYPSHKQSGVPQHVTLALVTGSSQLTTIKNLLDDIAAVGLAASQSESGVSEENETIVSS